MALNTRISDRILDACKDVLVVGMSGVAAAEKHKIFASQISRALTTLRDKQAKVMASASVREESDVVQQYIATEVARALVGKDFQCRLAQPGQTYDGPLIGQSTVYIVQKVGRHGVLHDLARFSDIPPLKQNLRIAYDAAGARAVVGPVPGAEKGKGPTL